ncbi:MAG TPA: tetratricopeptide repeat protein [Gammaproteobacteria bacterium]|nr:tetratricopeptide repeat protein [Gammaproteobacteria bacterium]
MSLINEVLRKLDQQPGSPRTRGLPPHLHPARRQRKARRHLAGWTLSAFLLGGLAGGGLWWWVSGGGGRPETASTAPAEPSTETGKPESLGGDPASHPQDHEGGAKAVGKDGDQGEEGPRKAEEATASASEPGPAESMGNKQPAQPAPAAPEVTDSSSPAAAPKQSGGADKRPPRFKPSRVPLKIPVAPSATPHGAGKAGPSGQASEVPSAADAVHVRVPDAWQRRKQAGNLARKGYEALRAGRYSRALTHLEKANRLDPGRGDIANNLALARWRSGRREAAIGGLLEAVGKDPSDPRLARNLAHFLLQGGTQQQREEGTRTLSRALRAQQDTSLYALVGALYRKQGKSGDAVRIYRAGLARGGSDWRLLLGLGLALEADGHPARALTVYRKMEKRLPPSRKALRQRVQARIAALDVDGN